MPGVEAIVKFINGGKNEEHGNHGGDAEEDDHIFFLHTIRKRVNQSERNLSKLFNIFTLKRKNHSNFCSISVFRF